MRSRKLEIAWLLIGLVLLAAVFATVYRNNWSPVLDALEQSWHSPLYLCGAFVLFFATLVSSLLKWHLMCRQADAGMTFRQSLRLFATLYLVGTFTPGRAGELLVPVLMRGGARLTGVALINRVLESSWTLFVAAGAAVLIFAGDPRAQRLWALAPILALFLAVMIVLSRRRFTKALLGLARRCLGPFKGWRPVGWLLALEEKYAAGLEHFYDANERLLRLPPVALFSVLMSVIWALMVWANYLLIQASVPSGGKEVTFIVVVAMITVQAAASYLSPIPGGLGLSDLLSIGLLAQLGYEKEFFLPFLLLARVEFYVVVVLFYLVGRACGQLLPGPAADSPTD